MNHTLIHPPTLSLTGYLPIPSWSHTPSHTLSLTGSPHGLIPPPSPSQDTLPYPHGLIPPPSPSQDTLPYLHDLIPPPSHTLMVSYPPPPSPSQDTLPYPHGLIHPTLSLTGYPPIEGRTLLEKRRYVREKLDHLRTMIMREPRGHFDMYGALLVDSDLPEADLAVLFMHNEGRGRGHYEDRGWGHYEDRVRSL